MALAQPMTMSPSKLTAFTNCALAFRFVNIDRLPQAPTVAAVRGTLVHRSLELLFGQPAPTRTLPTALDCLDAALAVYETEDEWQALGLDGTAEATLATEARILVERYFELEDPALVEPVGIELLLEATIGGVQVRGIIDRLDVVDGDLVVTDYKTGRSPDERNARSRMAGVHIYSLLVERTFGRRPARVQLLHLAEPVAIVTSPTEQSTRGVERRLGAVWSAVADACDREDFQPKPGGHCSWCSFQQWCPSFGGDPTQAVVDTQIAARSAAGQDPLLVL
jgi:putative RecB family exonuclease